jgi:hypothetical protein
MAENSETLSRGRMDHLYYTCTQYSTQTGGEVKHKVRIEQKNLALQNDKKNTKVLPFKPNKRLRAKVSMLEIAGHVAIQTIHLMER